MNSQEFCYLGNRYGLLLHNFVNGCSIAFIHFVKLINATDTLQENEFLREGFNKPRKV